MVSQWDFEWNIFPGFNTLYLSQEVQELLLKFVETLESFTGRIIFMSMFNDTSWGSKDNKVECESNANLVSIYARRFGAGQWSFLVLVQRKSGILPRTVHKEPGTILRRKCCWNSQKADTQFFVSWVHCPRGVLKSKGSGKLSIHFFAVGDTIETVFRTVISVNQFSIYGAVSDLCEKIQCVPIERRYPLWKDNLSNPLFVPSVIKTEVLVNTDDRAHKGLPLQTYGERIEKLSQKDRLSKFCLDIQDWGMLLKSESISWHEILHSYNSQMQWLVVSTLCQETARRKGSPKHVSSRRRRTPEGPEPACVQTLQAKEWHTQEKKDELTSCRGTVQSAWQKPSVSRAGGRARLTKKDEWPPRGTGTTVLTYPRSAPRGTGKAGENGQNSGEVVGSSPWTRPSAPECGTLKALAGDQRPI